MASGGGYAKGIAKKEEIVEVALRLIAERGYNAATIREIADAVGLSIAGIQHHFGSKEALFTEILRSRDAHDRPTPGAEPQPADALRMIISRNTAVPGLMQLYARLSAEAIAPEHGAHEYFRDRFERLRAELASDLAEMQAAGDLSADMDLDAVSTAAVALLDGLQTQWLYDNSIDMEHVLSALFGFVRPLAATSNPSPAE